ncbi:MAG TPA: hypothetical protein VJM09_13670 [Sphingobium sp.]|nr:hypothetical protein [Sphingobium sp.]
MRRITCLIALSVLPTAALAAPDRAPSCADAPPPPEPWTSWTQSGNAVAGGEAGSAPRLILGKPILATLRPVEQVQFPVRPSKAQPKSHGGLFTLALKDPARIGIALSGPAWLDVVSGKTAAASIEHGHGPDCSGIRKIVWFDLAQGLHLIQIANSAQREIRIMAADARANRPVSPAEKKPF